MTGMIGRAPALITAATLLAAVFLIAACGTSDDGQGGRDEGEAGAADLTFIFRAEPSAGPERAKLTCPAVPGDPAGREACRELDRVPAETFEPVPPGTACTQIYGGPETVLVTGRLDGREIDSELSRSDGCEIARWDSLSPVLASLGLGEVGRGVAR